MRLKAAGEVIEAGLVVHVASEHITWQVGDSVRQFVPDAVEFVRGCRGRRFAARIVDNQRVELDHLRVTVQRLHDGFPCDIRRERSDGSEDRSL